MPHDDLLIAGGTNTILIANGGGGNLLIAPSTPEPTAGVGGADQGLFADFLIPAKKQTTPFTLNVTTETTQPVHFDLQTKSKEYLFVPTSLKAISKISEIVPHRLWAKDLLVSILPTQLISIGPHAQDVGLVIIASSSRYSIMDAELHTREIKKANIDEDILTLLFMDD